MADDVLLSEAVDILSGRYLPVEEYDETGDYVIYGSNSIMGRASKPLYDGPLVVFARVGSNAGAVMYSEKPAWINNNAAALRVKEGWNARYLFYWASNFDLRTIAQGSGQPFISNQTLNSVRIARREAVEQQSIASVLGALDDKIELNRRMNETLEAMARAIFRDWFVDFGPTRAKMAMRGEDPQKDNVARAPYLAPDIWALFPDRLDDEGKPEGWEVSTIGNFIELLDHKRVPLSSQERAKRQGPYPYHGATSVMDHIDSYLFDEKLLLLGEDGSVAKADGRPFTQYVWGKLWVNNHAHVIKGRGVSIEQLKLFFDQIDIRPFVTGAVQQKLNQANLRRVPYLRATHKIHLAFDTIIAPIYDLVRHQNEESRTLAATRDLLLPKLMSGEIRVKDAETLAEQVT